MLLAVEDLAKLPGRPSTLVEGPQVLPDLLPRGAAAVFLNPTKEFQRSILQRRALPPTADPRLALKNRIKKDQLYAERVASLAAEREFAVLLVDGRDRPRRSSRQSSTRSPASSTRAVKSICTRPGDGSTRKPPTVSADGLPRRNAPPQPTGVDRDGRPPVMPCSRFVGILEARPKSRMFVIGPATLAIVMIFVMVAGNSGPLRSSAPFVLVLALGYVAWGLWPGPRRP